jgi:hypothetical protein
MILGWRPFKGGHLAELNLATSKNYATILNRWMDDTDMEEYGNISKTGGWH